jgi:hypothetical protein
MRNFVAILFFSVGAFAQTGFWDAATIAETGLYAGAIAVDGWSTQAGVARGGFVEENPLARPFVYRGVPGQTAACVLGFGAGVVPSYLLYRKGHRKLARAWLGLFTVGETVNSAQMYSLVTHKH